MSKKSASKLTPVLKKAVNQMWDYNKPKKSELKTPSHSLNQVT